MCRLTLAAVGLVCLIGLTTAIVQMELKRTKSMRQTLIEYRSLLAKSDHKNRAFIDGMLRQASANFGHFYDLEYYVQVNIGTPAQTFNMLISTAISADVFVLSKKCTETGCKLHHLYDSSASSTYKATNDHPFDFEEDGIDIEGIYNIDTVTVGGASAKGQTFIALTEFPEIALTTIINVDGLLGLAMQTLSTTKQPFLENLYEQNENTAGVQKLFSLYYNPNTKSTLGGALILGGTNPMYYTGAITYVQVNSKDFWRFNSDSISVGSSQLCAKCPVVIAAESAVFFGPPSNITALNQALKATKTEDGVWTLNCASLSSLPSVNFVINGKNFPLTASQFAFQIASQPPVCISPFIESPDWIPDPNWVIGTKFLTQYYSIYDIGNFQIGFAQSSPTTRLMEPEDKNDVESVKKILKMLRKSEKAVESRMTEVEEEEKEEMEKSANEEEEEMERSEKEGGFDEELALLETKLSSADKIQGKKLAADKEIRELVSKLSAKDKIKGKKLAAEKALRELFDVIKK